MLFNKCETVDYWDRMLKVERQLLGPHFPNITSTLFKKWAFIGKTIDSRTNRSDFKRWKDMAKEVEKEFLITHGKEHPEYSDMMNNINSVDMMARVYRH